MKIKINIVMSAIFDSNTGNFISISAVFIELYTIYFASTSNHQNYLFCQPASINIHLNKFKSDWHMPN